MLPLPTNLTSQILDILTPASRVLILAHKSPDADTIGAATSFAKILTRLGKQAVVFCLDKLPFALQLIPGSNLIISDLVALDPSRYDVIITVDIADPRMVGIREPWLQEMVPIINLDHHATNSNFGRINLVIPQASSACELLWTLFKEWGWQLDADIATALLHGILIDTGGFSNRGTTVGSLGAAGALLLEGGRYQSSLQRLFGYAPISKLQLWGRAFARLQHDPIKKITMTCVLYEDFIACDAVEEHAEGIANYLNGLTDSNMICIWREQKQGEVKASLRTTKEHVNVAAVAQRFAGGGHTKAAGFSFPGKIVQLEGGWQVQHEDGQQHPFFMRPQEYVGAKNF